MAPIAPSGAQWAQDGTCRQARNGAGSTPRYGTACGQRTSQGVGSNPTQPGSADFPGGPPLGGIPPLPHGPMLTLPPTSVGPAPVVAPEASQLDLLLHPMERGKLELIHSDVFTGVGSWPEVASEVGITPTNACELQPAQRQLLRRRWPRLQLTSDFRRTKFTSWAPSTQQRLWGTASPACQGLTVSGKGALRHYADVRNDQTIMCPAMFRAMGASVACIEQVSELVTLDDTHGMLTSLYSAAVQHGYMPLGASLYMHSQFGGGTSRCRAVPVMELQHLHEVLPVSHLPSAPPSSVTAAKEWVQAGSRPHLQLQQGLFTFTPAASRHLLSDAPTTVRTLRWGGPGTALQPGVLCRLHSSPTRLFNIMEHHGDRLLLIQQPRASSCKLWALTSDVDLDSLQVQRTPVKDVMGLASPIRGFGEPPRHTSML